MIYGVYNLNLKWEKTIQIYCRKSIKDYQCIHLIKSIAKQYKLIKFNPLYISI